MSDIYKPISDDRPTSYTNDPLFADESTNEVGRALLAAVVGGVASAAGYLVYTRLPDDQKEKLRAQVRQLVESRVNELRGRFNI
jgi:hypothetical protein